MTALPSLPPLLNRLRRVAPHWDSSLRLSKLGALQSSQAVTSVPQGKGTPGWLILTRDPVPIPYFVARQNTPTPIPIRMVVDERLFEDSIFRVEKTATHLYLADIWMLNGVPMFHTTTFAERQDLLTQLFHSFWTDCPPFQTLSVQLRASLPMEEVRGREFYTNERGAIGIYKEDTNDAGEAILDIVKTDIPDVYKIPSRNEYLQVKTLKLSRDLRTLGAEFSLPCVNNRDGTWTPITT